MGDGGLDVATGERAGRLGEQGDGGQQVGGARVVAILISGRGVDGGVEPIGPVFELPFDDSALDDSSFDGLGHDAVDDSVDRLAGVRAVAQRAADHHHALAKITLYAGGYRVGTHCGQEKLDDLFGDGLEFGEQFAVLLDHGYPQVGVSETRT